MKKFALALALTFALPAVSMAKFASPDILVDSTLDHDWSQLLVLKVRRLLKNFGYADPFKSKLEGPIEISDLVVSDYLSKDSKLLINDIGNAVGLSLVQGTTKVSIEGLAYDVEQFKMGLKATRKEVDGLVISSDFLASKVNVKADKLVLTLEIPGKAGNKGVPVVRIEIIKPNLVIEDKDFLGFFAAIKIQEDAENFSFKIMESSFKDLARYIEKNQDKISLDFDDIIIPDLAVRVGSKTLQIPAQKVENLIRTRVGQLKTLLFAQTAESLKKGGAETMLKLAEKYKINKEYWINNSIISSQIKIDDISSTLDLNNVEINLPGDFCTKDNFEKNQKACIHQKITKEKITRLNQDHHQQSISEMKEIMGTQDANIVASVSEDYVNKLLVATYDAGLWDSMLKESDIELGPKKVFMRLDERGKTGTLYMDLVYKPSKFQGFVIGARSINFPLVLKVSVRVEKHEGLPVIMIHLNDADTSDATLINGRPEVGLVSTIHKIPRLKKQVVKTIRNKVLPLKGKDILDLRYPELKGLGLETVEFVSDGNGRMNALMKLSDLIHDEELN